MGLNEAPLAAHSGAPRLAVGSDRCQALSAPKTVATLPSFAMLAPAASAKPSRCNQITDEDSTAERIQYGRPNPVD